MECLAVIPARGGSTGLPRKNLTMVGGVPLVVRAVRSALAASHITRTVVSTEDEEIANVARDADAEVVMRPAELADDIIMPDFAVLHVLETLVSEEDYHPDLVCFIQCTSSLTRPDDLGESRHFWSKRPTVCCRFFLPIFFCGAERLMDLPRA